MTWPWSQYEEEEAGNVIRRDLRGRKSAKVNRFCFAGLPELTGQAQEAAPQAFAGHHQTGQHAVNQRAPQRFVATADLARDDRGPQHLFGMIVGGRHLRIVQEDEPLAAMSANVIVESLQFGTELAWQAVKPSVQTIFDFLHAACVTSGLEFVTASRQVDGFEKQRAQEIEIFLFLGGHDIGKFLAAAQEVRVAAALGVIKDIVSSKAIDDEIAIEVGAEQVRRHVMATTADAGANDVDGNVLAGEDPEPTVDRVDAPAGFVGVHDMRATQGIDQQFISGLGEFGETLLGANEGGGADVEVAVGVEEVADFAIGHAEPMLEFGRQRQDDGAERVACRADRVGDLLGVPALTHLAATRTAAGLNVELRDDRRDRRQIGLILHHGVEVVQRRVAFGALVARHVDDTINAIRRRRGPQRRRMSLGSAGSFGFGLAFLAAKGRGLALLLSANFVEFTAQLGVLRLDFDKGLPKSSVFGAERLTTRTARKGSGHGFHPELDTQ